ncbi:MAG TPA: GDP-mannose 4,6-dehydratase [Gemmatimonadales bacterium]|jgi:UDP-glucuronate 4-epimerase
MTGRILVTGAAGFIGSHLCDALLGGGWEVVGLDNFDPFYDRAIKESSLASLRRHGRFSFVEGDIRDDATVTRCLRDADVVVHLAARAGVRPSLEDPGLYASVNVLGTTMILEACRRAGVRRVVFGSSSSVYGDDTPVPFAEAAMAIRPISPYAATKRAGELLCATFSHLYGLRVAALRFFTVYGPRQRPDLAIHKFTRLISDAQPLDQYGDGSAERDHTHVSDIVQGVMGAVAWTEPDEPACDVFNLGESRTIRLDELISLIGHALGRQPEVRRLLPQPGDVRRTCADIAKARSALGYAPRVGIEDGIREFVSWFRRWRGN